MALALVLLLLAFIALGVGFTVKWLLIVALVLFVVALFTGYNGRPGSRL